MESSNLDGMVTYRRLLQALVDVGLVEPDKSLAVSHKSNELAQALWGVS